MKPPATPERPIKKVIVSVWYRNQRVWAMVNARKVGGHYQISPAVLNGMLEKAGCYNHGTTFTLG